MKDQLKRFTELIENTPVHKGLGQLYEKIEHNESSQGDSSNLISICYRRIDGTGSSHEDEIMIQDLKLSETLSDAGNTLFDSDTDWTRILPPTGLEIPGMIWGNDYGDIIQIMLSENCIRLIGFNSGE